MNVMENHIQQGDNRYANKYMSVLKRAIVFVIAIWMIIDLQGQTFTPENMGASINSMYDDINPVVSPDDKTLFFVRVNHPENTYGDHDSEDIWYSERQPDGTWSGAKRIPVLNIGRYNSVLSISADGQTLLLNGVYNKRGTIWKKRGLSTSTKTEDGWSKPKKLKVSKLSKLNRGLKSSGMMSKDENFLVLSFSRVYNSKKTNMFVSFKTKKGKWTKPRPIKKLNSTVGSEDTPFLSADGQTLYFSSDYDNNDQYDIYKIPRMGDGWKEWGDLEKVTEVNSEGWEGYYHLNAKESYAYFSSERGGAGGADIFRIKIFEENPFIIVSGNVLNAKTQQLFKGKKFTIDVNGSPADSVIINPDSATYKLMLKMGKSYDISAKAENYRSRPQQINATSSTTITMTKDLYVEPIPYVLVKGKLLNESTGSRIPASAHPKIKINNMIVDSVSIDTLKGEYTVKINYGKSYSVVLEADNYDPIPKKLDLTAIDEYRVMNFDLGGSQHREKPVVTAPKIGVAYISGSIIDQNTGKPLLPSVNVLVNVEGVSDVSVDIDPDTRAYSLQLPTGKSYTLSATASNYYPVYEAVDLTAIKGGNANIKRDLTVVPIEVGQQVRLNNIFFESGKATLKKESFPELDRVAKFLKENPNIKIEIAGHTDNVGSASSNQTLSEARAKSVAYYIATRGIKTTRLIAKGYGLSKPVASNNTAEGRAKNRRVEFSFLDKSLVMEE